jgi:hypothetical protein
MASLEQLELAVVSVTNFVDANLKQVALTECLDDIDAGYWQGTLTVGQKRRLVAILLGIVPNENWAERDPRHPSEHLSC